MMTLCLNIGSMCYIALSLGLRGSTPGAAADPTNGAIKSASDKPKVSLCMVLTTEHRGTRTRGIAFQL